MKKLLLVLLVCALGVAAQEYTVTKETTLSSSAEVITVQQPATGAKIVRFVGAYIYSAGACGITLERTGTAATSTALTRVPLHESMAAATATAWYSSNVGTGTTLGKYLVPAGGSLTLDLTGLALYGNGTGKNVTIRTASCTGDAKIVLQWKEY